MSSSESWKLKVRKKIYRILKKFPEKDRQRIVKIIEGLPLDPYTGDIEKMAGEEDSWRRRVGAYRIFYELIQREKIIHVFRIERRTSKTY